MKTYDQLLDALGDPTRRSIVDLLAERPRSVAALARELPVSRPAVSQHLRILADAGLVGYRRNGTRHVYRLEPRGLEPLRAWVDSMWDDVLRAYAEAIVEDRPKKRDTKGDLR
ncbi:MAG: metalloregulator ArsR/SmtB family transcription factor [Gemmatimonadota bacterium]|nr:metalloregulator ArsR/SmtB family transcription factor [Gemmatimonadota bacterium]